MYNSVIYDLCEWRGWAGGGGGTTNHYLFCSLLLNRDWTNFVFS